MNVNDIERLKTNDLISLVQKYKLNKSFKDTTTLPREQLLLLVKQYISQKSDLGDVPHRFKKKKDTSGPPKSDVPYTRDVTYVSTNNESRTSECSETTSFETTSNEWSTKYSTRISQKDAQYDATGLYPKVKRLVAIGDVHGISKLHYRLFVWHK